MNRTTTPATQIATAAADSAAATPSFAHLLERLEPKLKKLAGVYSRRWKKHRYADDFHQEGRIAIWQAMERHDPKKGKLERYVVSAAIKAMLQYDRDLCSLHRVHRATSQEALAWLEEQPGDHVNPAARKKPHLKDVNDGAPAAESKMFADAILDRASALLTTRQWEVFNLVDVLGYQQVEVADMLGVTEAAISITAKAAKKRLGHYITIELFPAAVNTPLLAA